MTQVNGEKSSRTLTILCHERIIRDAKIDEQVPHQSLLEEDSHRVERTGNHVQPLEGDQVALGDDPPCSPHQRPSHALTTSPLSGSGPPVHPAISGLVSTVTLHPSLVEARREVAIADMAAHATGGRGPSLCSTPMTISHVGSFPFIRIWPTRTSCSIRCQLKQPLVAETNEGNHRRWRETGLG
jgi:hypothetical protein